MGGGAKKVVGGVVTTRVVKTAEVDGGAVEGGGAAGAVLTGTEVDVHTGLGEVVRMELIGVSTTGGGGLLGLTAADWPLSVRKSVPRLVVVNSVANGEPLVVGAPT